MALVMCFINGLKRTGCFQTAVFAHRASALLVRRRLVGVSVSCWCAGVLRFAGQEERPKTNGAGFRTRTHVVAGSLWARVVVGRSGARVVAYRFQMSRADERGCVHQRRGSNVNMQLNSLGPRRMTMRRGPKTSGHVIGRRSERAPLGLDL